jgi:hypothetical protein
VGEGAGHHNILSGSTRRSYHYIGWRSREVDFLRVDAVAGKSYLRITKGVFSNMNILAIALTTSAFSLMEHGWRPFWNLYLKTELNASIPVLGLLAMTQSSERLLFQLPGGLRYPPTRCSPSPG